MNNLFFEIVSLCTHHTSQSAVVRRGPKPRFLYTKSVEEALDGACCYWESKSNSAITGNSASQIIQHSFQI